MYLYCSNDITLLRLAVVQFRQLMQRVTGRKVGEEIDPEMREVYAMYEDFIYRYAFITIASIAIGAARRTCVVTGNTPLSIDMGAGKEHVVESDVKIAEKQFASSPMGFHSFSEIFCQEQLFKGIH